MNKFYDNQANTFDYFDLNKPKVEVKKKREYVDITTFSDSELCDKLDEIENRIEELGELYNLTKHSGTFEILSRVSSFKSVIRTEMRKRRLETNQVLKAKILELESNPVSNDNPKELKHLNLVNENMKNEIKALKGKIEDAKKHKSHTNYADNFKLRARNKELGEQIEELKLIISENREAEKTKRHELSVKGDKYVCSYLLEFVKNTVTEEEYNEVISDLNDIRKETPQ